MNYRVHRIGGICAGTIMTALIIKPPFTTQKLFLAGAIIVGAIIGCSIPDIDKRNSHIGNAHKILSFGASLAGHRKFFHTLLFFLIFSVISMYLGLFLIGLPQILYSSFTFGLITGILSHLFIDMLTSKGIPIFYPVIKTNFKIAQLHSNNIIHAFIVSILLVSGTAITVYKLIV